MIWVITFVLREADRKRGVLDLLTEKVSLVKQQYDGAFVKVDVIHNVVEHSQTLVHAILEEAKELEKLKTLPAYVLHSCNELLLSI